MNNCLKGHSHHISKADYRTALLKTYHFDTRKKVQKWILFQRLLKKICVLVVNEGLRSLQQELKKNRVAY